MKTIIKKIIVITITISIILSVISGIIISINIVAKQNKEQKWAESNKIKIGNEEILYVDLTTKTEDYNKINSQNNEIENQNNSKKTENVSIENEKKSEIEKEQIKEDIEYKKEEINNNKEIKTTEQKNVETEKEQHKDSEFSTKKILVKSSNIDKINSAKNIESIVKISEDMYSIHYSSQESTELGYNELTKDDAIENVMKDYKVRALENDINIEALNVPENKQAWGIFDTGLVNLKAKNENNKNASQIKVAVLDSGVRATHEVFKNIDTADRLDLANAYNYVEKNTDIEDTYGHGTMVSGIIAEGTSNNVKIVPIKTLNNEGNGTFITVLEAMASISNKVDVINLSLGMSEKEINETTKTYCEEFFKAFYDLGIPVVCASGNKGEEDIYYPASSKYTIAVGATTINKEIASFSNYGNSLDFVAPGEALILPYPTTDTYYTEEGSVHKVNNKGTSFAAPFVTSAIAMIKSENRQYTFEQIKNNLIENTEDLGVQGKDKYYGYGLLNLNTNMFNKPVIVSFEVVDIDEQSISITMNAVCGNKITNWSYSNTDTKPNEWRAYKNGSTNVFAKLTTLNNKDCYIWFKDEKGNVTGQKVYTAKINNKTETDIMYGDMNLNKIIDSGDILKLQRHIAVEQNKSLLQRHSNWMLTPELIKMGDLNRNNKIDIGDILKIRRYIATQQSEKIKEKHPDWAILISK